MMGDFKAKQAGHVRRHNRMIARSKAKSARLNPIIESGEVDEVLVFANSIPFKV
jgi:hypothetical protein